MSDSRNRDVEPDAVKIACQEHCQKRGVNLYENGKYIGDRYDDGKTEPTFKPNIGCNVTREPLFSAETIHKAMIDILDDAINEFKTNEDVSVYEMRSKICKEIDEVFGEQ